MNPHQKVIIPKGTINPDQNSVIEIPYQYRNEPVVVVTPRNISSRSSNVSRLGRSNFNRCTCAPNAIPQVNNVCGAQDQDIVTTIKEVNETTVITTDGDDQVNANLDASSFNTADAGSLQSSSGYNAANLGLLPPRTAGGCCCRVPPSSSNSNRLKTQNRSGCCCARSAARNRPIPSTPVNSYRPSASSCSCPKSRMPLPKFPKPDSNMSFCSCASGKMPGASLDAKQSGGILTDRKGADAASIRSGEGTDKGGDDGERADNASELVNVEGNVPNSNENKEDASQAEISAAEADAEDGSVKSNATEGSGAEGSEVGKPNAEKSAGGSGGIRGKSSTSSGQKSPCACLIDEPGASKICACSSNNGPSQKTIRFDDSSLGIMNASAMDSSFPDDGNIKPAATSTPSKPKMDKPKKTVCECDGPRDICICGNDAPKALRFSDKPDQSSLGILDSSQMNSTLPGASSLGILESNQMDFTGASSLGILNSNQMKSSSCGAPSCQSTSLGILNSPQMNSGLSNCGAARPNPACHNSAANSSLGVLNSSQMNSSRFGQTNPCCCAAAASSRYGNNDASLGLLNSSQMNTCTDNTCPSSLGVLNSSQIAGTSFGTASESLGIMKSSQMNTCTDTTCPSSLGVLNSNQMAGTGFETASGSLGIMNSSQMNTCTDTTCPSSLGVLHSSQMAGTSFGTASRSLGIMNSSQMNTCTDTTCPSSLGVLNSSQMKSSRFGNTNESLGIMRSSQMNSCNDNTCPSSIGGTSLGLLNSSQMNTCTDATCPSTTGGTSLGLLNSSQINAYTDTTCPSSLGIINSNQMNSSRYGTSDPSLGIMKSTQMNTTDSSLGILKPSQMSSAAQSGRSGANQPFRCVGYPCSPGYNQGASTGDESMGILNSYQMPNSRLGTMGSSRVNSADASMGIMRSSQMNSTDPSIGIMRSSEMHTRFDTSDPSFRSQTTYSSGGTSLGMLRSSQMTYCSCGESTGGTSLGILRSSEMQHARFDSTDPSLRSQMTNSSGGTSLGILDSSQMMNCSCTGSRGGTSLGILHPSQMSRSTASDSSLGLMRSFEMNDLVAPRMATSTPNARMPDDIRFDVDISEQLRIADATERQTLLNDLKNFQEARRRLVTSTARLSNKNNI